MVVNDFLMEYFPDIMDYNFTANVEEKFDHIAEGQTNGTTRLPISINCSTRKWKISNLRLEHKVGERVLGTDPKTGKEVSVKSDVSDRSCSSDRPTARRSRNLHRCRRDSR